MGQLVSVIASTHNPRICWNRDEGHPDDLKELDATFKVLHDGLDKAKPDTIIFIGNDHLDSFFLDNLPSFSIVTGPKVAGPYWYEDEIMHLPDYKASVNTDLAHDILKAGLEEGVAFSRAYDARLDHAFTLPLSFIRPERDIPLVPIFTNVFCWPIAPSHVWIDLGKFLRRMVEARPANERIAIMCSFNLTVEVGGPLMGAFDREFSKMMLDMMEEADVAKMQRELTIPKLISKGNSTAEFLNYFAILGVMGNRKPDFIKHKPVRGVGTCPVAMWNNP
jgi:protocatechuate 4,5-dioxygenase beta chain